MAKAMKKLYEDMHLICGKSSEDFMDKLSKAIDDYQLGGYQVEVQYALNNSLLSALVLAYKRKEQ